MFPDILFSPVVTVTERITRFNLVQHNCFIFQNHVKARNLCLVYILDELLETLKQTKKKTTTRQKSLRIDTDFFKYIETSKIKIVNGNLEE